MPISDYSICIQKFFYRFFGRSKGLRYKLPNGSGLSRAQGLPPNQDDDHAKYLSQKARVFGVGCNTVLGMVSSANVMPLP